MTRALVRRMLPLYAALFSQGFILYYVVDKLLATSLGMSATAIAVAVGIMAAVTIISEIPSGIMADRWSRKGVLLIAQVLLGISTAIGIFASQPWHYVLYAAVWGIFFAMYSGLFEAIVYDLLLEEQGHAKNFEKVYAHFGQLEGGALLAGSLLGGLIAGRWGVHAPFIWTMPSIILGIAAIAVFKEPRIHRAVDDHARLVAHTRQTFAAVRHSDVLKSLFLVTAAMGGAIRLLWEFNQLWYINLSLPVVLFGVFNASIFVGLIIRGWAIPRIVMNRFRLLVVCISLAITLTGLLMVPHAYVAAVGVTLVMFAILSAELVLKVLQQDRLPSRLRAGATSVFSTVSHLVSIPMYVLFGVLIDKFGVSHASLLITLMFSAGLIFAVRAWQKSATESALVVE